MAIASGDPAMLVLAADGLPVAGPVAKPASGDPVVIVMGDDGLPIGITGGAEANPCDPDPEMLLTVTGTTGTINWCGQTWVLPGESGAQKSVCPTTYGKAAVSGNNSFFGGGLGNGTYGWRAYHIWSNSLSGALDLRREMITIRMSGGRLYRHASYTPTVAPALFNFNRLALKGSVDDGGFFGGFTASITARPVAITYTQVPPYATWSLGVISTAGPAEFTAYSLTNTWFPIAGVNIGGINYKWEKGAGW